MAGADRVHEPVMLQEVLSLLAPQPGETFLDGTVGPAGHTSALLDQVTPGGKVHGVDLDQAVLALAEQALSVHQSGGDYALHHGSFSDIERIEALADLSFDGVLLDLGISSFQLDQGARGFSFQQDGPLDMRMDDSRGRTAGELIHELSEADLADLIYQYGEERRSRQVARAIVAAREREQIRTTTQLAEIVRRAVGGRRGKTHPATRTFQALRIAVNGELQSLELGINRLVERLQPGGRIAIISFHSLEDRIVKHQFSALEKSGGYERLTRKPMRPGEMELMRNRRSRSAKLRGLRRLTS